MLILGYKTKIASYGSGILLLIFAVSMTVALGTKAPLDYSVWVGSAGTFLLAVQQEYQYSIDYMIRKNNPDLIRIYKKKSSGSGRLYNIYKKYYYTFSATPSPTNTLHPKGSSSKLDWIPTNSFLRLAA
ncbi:Uncharacterised protein [Elizabethkingia miricola]|nr:Uncharacterised protein [Elizabethkingia miricola]